MRLITLSVVAASSLFAAQSFKEIKFEGLTQISKEIALETINLKKTNQYEQAEINDAIKKFYKFNYFKDIWVENKDSTLTFHFQEKPFIVKLEMSGYKKREDDLDLIFMTMGLKKGTMYTEKRIENAKKILLQELEREGYTKSVVEIETEKISDTGIVIKFNVNKGSEIKIKKITYKGAKNLDVSDFEEVIANKEEDCCFTWFYGQNDGKMSLEQLKYDSMRIRELYLKNGYLDVKVSGAFSKIDFNTNTAHIEYDIVEGKQYSVNDIMVYIDESIANADDIIPELRLEKGDIFNIEKIRKDKEYINTLAADKGYAFSETSYNIRKNPDNNTIDIIYSVVQGEKVYINDVIIAGNHRTLDRVIRRNIFLAPKDLFNLTDYKDSVNALKRTGYFESVNIKKQRVTADKMNLIVDVREAATGQITLGGGFGSYDGWMINASIKDKNIFGSGLGLGFEFDYSSKKNNYTLSLSNPAINDSRYNGDFNIHRNESTIENDTSVDGDKVSLEKGFGVGLGRSIGRHSRAGINYSYDDTMVNYEKTDTEDSDFTTSAISPYLKFNNTDDYYLPRSGIIANTSLKYAGIGGDAKYILSNTNFKYFYSLEKATDFDIIFRYKNNLKLLEDTGYMPKDTTFYLGGARSLRGYKSYAFQPDDYADKELFNRYLTNTIELSFPLLPKAKMRWALFYDHGMIGEDSFSDFQRSGAGALISWLSPVGPVQFIFANALDAKDGEDTANFEFSLGSSF